MLLATSGLAGVVFHLCGMEGVVRSSCCCHEADQGHEAPVKLERVDECCGAVLSTSEHPTVSSDSSKLNADPLISLASSLGASDGFPACGKDRVLSLARDPPPDHGPPLFIRHCAYLN